MWVYLEGRACGMIPGVSAAHALLGLLEGEPRHGYDLKRAWDRRFGHLKAMRYSQVYATLSRLERDGLIELVGEEPGQGPDRKRYRITPDGTADLARWLAEPDVPDGPVHADLFAKVVLALDTDHPVDDFLEAQRAVHTQRMRDLLDRRDHADEVERAALDLAVFHLEADLRWIDHARRRLERIAAELSRGSDE